MPAGAFQTPRVASVRAYRPATVPLGPMLRKRLPLTGSGTKVRGKYTAASRLRSESFCVIQVCMPSSDAVSSGMSISVKPRRPAM